MRKIVLFLLVLTIVLSSCASNDEEMQTTKEIDKSTLYIVVDPGHGLYDVGALHEENLGEITEAMINFAVAKELSNELTMRGYNVIMTHDGSTAPDTEGDAAVFTPSERAEFSNSQNADLFISIHCDSYPENDEVYGTRVYYARNKIHNTKNDKKFAKAIAKCINKKFPDDKSVIIKEMDGADSYTVLYKSNVPAVLIECGFITSKKDAEKLTNAEWQKNFATALADGIDNYF
ncbi:MAG: N-acetylmuramoyl-L-alanine amidase [Clostridia bacterium]|nr:N-acetylmuramoyl-L-alanine amidase [Clostridia bacterium]